MGEILDPSASGSTGNINLESIEGAQIKRGQRLHQPASIFGFDFTMPAVIFLSG